MKWVTSILAVAALGLGIYCFVSLFNPAYPLGSMDHLVGNILALVCPVAAVGLGALTALI